MTHSNQRWLGTAIAIAMTLGVASCKTANEANSAAMDVGNPNNQSCRAIRFMYDESTNILRAADAANRDHNCGLTIPVLDEVDAPSSDSGVPRSTITANLTSTADSGAGAAGVAVATTTAAATAATSMTKGSALHLDDTTGTVDSADSCKSIKNLIDRWVLYRKGVKYAWGAKNCSPAAEAREGAIHIFNHPTCGVVDFSVATQLVPPTATCNDNVNEAQHTFCYTCQPGPFGAVASSSAITCASEIEARSAIGIWCSENDCGGKEPQCRVAGTPANNPPAVTDTTDIDTTTLDGKTTFETNVKGEVGVFGNKVQTNGAVNVTMDVSAWAQIVNGNQTAPTEVKRDGRGEYGTFTTYTCGYTITGTSAAVVGANTEVGFKIPLLDTGATAGFSVTSTGSLARSLSYISGAHPAGGKTHAAVLTDCLNRGIEQAKVSFQLAQGAITAFIKQHASQSSDFVPLSSPYVSCLFEDGSRYSIKGLKWQLIPRQNPDYADTVELQLNTSNWFGATKSPLNSTQGIHIWSDSGNVANPGAVPFKEIWDTLAQSTPNNPPSHDFLVNVLNHNPFLPVNNKWYYSDCR